MIKKRKALNALCLCIILISVNITICSYCNATQQSLTILDITDMKGGFGKVSVTVKNMLNSTAEEVKITISVKGGILNNIDIEKICSGCDICGSTIEPNGVKTESTSEVGFIIGFGPITIIASAEALDAVKVEKTFTGFVIGPFVIVN